MTDAASTLSLIPNNYLKFGIFLAPFHAMNENLTQAMARDMALLEHIDALGYDEAWIGEHHSGGFEIIAARKFSLPRRRNERAIFGSAPGSAGSSV